MKFQIENLDILIKGIELLGDVDWQGLKILQGRDMFERAESITPIDTGELVRSKKFDMVDTFYYNKEYAPHVEYGHRTRGGGYVAGQHFLAQNIKAQEPIYAKDVEDWIKEKMAF